MTEIPKISTTIGIPICIFPWPFLLKWCLWWTDLLLVILLLLVRYHKYGIFFNCFPIYLVLIQELKGIFRQFWNPLWLGSRANFYSNVIKMFIDKSRELSNISRIKVFSFWICDGNAKETVKEQPVPEINTSINRW